MSVENDSTTNERFWVIASIIAVAVAIYCIILCLQEMAYPMERAEAISTAVENGYTVYIDGLELGDANDVNFRAYTVTLDDTNKAIICTTP